MIDKAKGPKFIPTFQFLPSDWHEISDVEMAIDVVVAEKGCPPDIQRTDGNLATFTFHCSPMCKSIILISACYSFIFCCDSKNPIVNDACLQPDHGYLFTAFISKP